jgi:hypothetical protein
VVHLLLFLTCILFIEFVLFFSIKSKFINIFSLLQKIIRYISSIKISDTYKEKVIPRLSIILLVESIKLLLIMSTIAFLLFLTIIEFNEFNKFIFSMYGLIEGLLFSYCYLKTRTLILSHQKF